METKIRGLYIALNTGRFLCKVVHSSYDVSSHMLGTKCILGRRLKDRPHLK
jgi:hypothetical protein